MNKFLVAFAIVLITACGSNDKPVVEEKPAEPVIKSKNSAVFNQSFGEVMDAYFYLKDNFIKENDSLINGFAKQLMKATDSIKFNELKDDATIIETAKSFAQGISAELKGLVGEKDIKNKRKSFNMVTDQVYNLIRTVKYDRQIIYHQHCPMAFEEGDMNAFWLSKSSEIQNPYLPKKMPTCGDVVDSLDYSK